jgi:hypothetical protein
MRYVSHVLNSFFHEVFVEVHFSKDNSHFT